MSNNGQLQPLHWYGEAFALSIQRRWTTLFTLAVVFEMREIRKSVTLPEVAGYHISDIHSLVDYSREFFPNHDDWWKFSKLVCRYYCEFFVLGNPSEQNTFAKRHSEYINDRFAVQNLAIASRGYAGPSQWKLT